MGGTSSPIFTPPGASPGDLANPNRSNNIGGARASSSRIFTEQTGTIFDLISEGEIEGLFNGAASVYLNETPLSNSSVVSTKGSRFGLANTTASSVTITSTGLFEGYTADGVRIVQIQGAEHQTTLASGATAGSTTISVASAFTNNSPVTIPKILTGNSDQTNIVIAGAGPDGDDYVGALVSVNGTTGTIFPAIQTSVSSGAAVEVDYFGAINTIVDDDTVGLARAVPVTVSSKPIQVLPLITNTTEDSNFSTASASFYPGRRNQSAAPRSNNVASASYVHAPNAELQQSTTTLGSSPISISNSIVGGNTTQPAQSPLSYTASTITGGASADVIPEIDSVSVELEVPSGLGYFVKDGDFEPALIEVQIAVEFDYGATTEEIVLVNQSPKLSGGSFQRQRAGISGNYPKPFTLKPQANDGLITAETQGSFLASFAIDLTPYQPFNDFTVKIARISPEIFDNYATDKGIVAGENALLACTVKTLQANIFEKLRYPNSAYAQVQFSAEDFETPPNRAYHIRGKKIKVPSNYITREELNYANPNSVEAKYTRNITTGVDEGTYQFWDGTFRGDESLSVSSPNYAKVYTNNPAWVFYDILTNKTYGLGDFIQESDIDVYSLYRIARYCDELVPDGKGGLEPRFACNVYITSAQEAYKALKDLASVFRGMMYWIDGQITAVQDSPKEPVYTFTQGNVIDGLFSYEYTGQRARINQVNVTWNDPDQFYRQSVVTVDDFDNIAEQNRVVTKDVVAYGCTSEGQATRVGRWHLLTDVQETELVKFQTSVNAGFLRPGDWIQVQDAKADSVEFSGRVSTGSTTTSIELDREVTLQSGQSYLLYLIFAEPGCYLQQDSATINSVSYVRGDLILLDHNGDAILIAEDASNVEDDSGNVVQVSFSKNTRLEKKSITSTGTTSTIAVSSAFSSAPGQDTVWAVSNINTQRVDAPRTYRVLAISEDAPNLYSIVGSKVVTEKYEELEKKWAVYVDPYKPVASKDDPVPAPSNVKIEMITVPGPDADSSGSSLRAIVSWNEPVESFTDSIGNIEEVKYRFIDSYEIQHNFYNSTIVPTTPISAGRNSITFDNISTSGEVVFKIRTRNTTGQRSPFVTVRRTTAPSQVPAPTFDRLSKIVLGGQINSPVTFNTSTGLIEITESNYLFVSSIGKRYDVIGATTAQSQVDFSSLSSGDTGYWYFDFSDASDPWKVMVEHTDSVVENTSGTTIDFSYWKELGASNNGLTLVSGTASIEAGKDEVTGVGTSFTTDFAVGDLIKLSNNNTYTEEAGAEYFEVAAVESDTQLFVRLNARKTFSGDYAYKQTFKPDFINDNILAAVGNTSGTFDIRYYILKSGEPGADGAPGENGLSITPSNGTHAFLQALDGTIDYTTYTCSFNVSQGGTALTFGASGPGTFSLAIDQQTNITASIDGSGNVTVSNMTASSADVDIEITINDTGATFTEVLTFVIVEQSSRGSSTFNFNVGDTGVAITAAEASGWAEYSGDSFTNTDAQAVADEVIAVSSDGFIRPNDKITVTDNASNVAGTRVYTGSAIASSGSIQASNFSSLVVETFDGSVIVDGTLSAGKLLADSTFSKNLTVGSTFTLDSSGKIVTSGKTSFTDPDAGFFLGYDAGAYKFNIGNSSKFISWDGIDLTVRGDIIIENASTVRSAINVADGADVTSANTAAGIAGQGALATQNSADFGSQVTGATKPEPNATAGATWGTNITGQPADGGQNLVRDPRFDLSSSQGGLAQSSYWTSGGTGWSITGTDGQDGGPAALFGSPSSTPGYIKTKYRIPIVPGERFYGQLRLNPSAGFNGTQFRLEMRLLNKNGGTASVANAFPDLVYIGSFSSSGWQIYSGEVVIPSSYTSVRYAEVWLTCNQATAGTLAVDDVYFGRASRGADTSGDTFTAQAGLLPNQNLSVRDSEQKPAGIYPVQGAVTDRSRISFETYSGTFGLALDGTGTTTVAAFPAIAIDDRFDYKVRIRHASSGTSSTGYYLRFNELNTYPGSGKTHIGFNTFPFTATKTSIVDLVSNGAVPGTSWVENEYDYTPTLGTKWASFSIYAWSGFSGVIYVDYVAIEPGTTAERGADVTSQNTAAAIAGQGALATLNSADFSTQVSGTTKPADNATNNGSTVDSSGNIVAPIELSGTGTIKAGKTAWNTGTGWLLEFNGGTPRFDIGNPAGNKLQWDGTNLTVAGTISVQNPSDVRTAINVADGADVTSQNTAAAIAGQGALATQNSADFGSQVTGATKPANNATNNGTTVNTSGNIAGSMTMISGGSIASGKTIYGSGTGWILEYNAGTPRFDLGSSSRYLRWDGSSLSVRGDIIIENASTVRSAINVADGADVTSANTAAGIAGQGALATQNSADFGSQVTGATKPANNATNNGTTVNTSGNIAGTMTMLSGGGITLSSAGFIKSAGKDSAYDTTAGFFMGASGGSYDFAIGNSSKFVRWDGSAGSLTVGGDLIATGNLQLNAATETDSEYDPNPTFNNFPTTTFQNLVSATITTTGTGPIRIECSCFAVYTVGQSTTMRFDVIRGTSTEISNIRTRDFAIEVNRFKPFVFVKEENLPAGTYTYTLRARNTSGFSTSIFDASILVREIKR